MSNDPLVEHPYAAAVEKLEQALEKRVPTVLCAPDTYHDQIVTLSDPTGTSKLPDVLRSIANQVEKEVAYISVDSWVGRVGGGAPNAMRAIAVALEDIRIPSSSLFLATMTSPTTVALLREEFGPMGVELLIKENLIGNRSLALNAKAGGDAFTLANVCHMGYPDLMRLRVNGQPIVQNVGLIYLSNWALAVTPDSVPGASLPTDLFYSIPKLRASNKLATICLDPYNPNGRIERDSKQHRKFVELMKNPSAVDIVSMNPEEAGFFANASSSDPIGNLHALRNDWAVNEIVIHGTYSVVAANGRDFSFVPSLDLDHEMGARAALGDTFQALYCLARRLELDSAEASMVGIVAATTLSIKGYPGTLAEMKIVAENTNVHEVSCSDASGLSAVDSRKIATFVSRRRAEMGTGDMTVRQLLSVHQRSRLAAKA